MGWVSRLLTAVAAVAIFGSALPSRAATIYFDDFNGSSGTDLAGTAPDIRPGSEVWLLGTADTAIPPERWKADGSVLGSSSGGGGASALLPFTPSSGLVYELSVFLNPDLDDGSTDWMAIGFVTATGAMSGNGAPWAFKRGASGSYDTNSFLGPATAGGASHGAPSGTQPLATEFRIELDTTAALWAVEWFIDGSSVRTASYATNPTITHVGIQRFETISGSVREFKLTVVPEPGSLVLLGAGLIPLLAARRKRR